MSDLCAHSTQNMCCCYLMHPFQPMRLFWIHTASLPPDSSSCPPKQDSAHGGLCEVPHFPAASLSDPVSCPIPLCTLFSGASSISCSGHHFLSPFPSYTSFLALLYFLVYISKCFCFQFMYTGVLPWLSGPLKLEL